MVWYSHLCKNFPVCCNPHSQRLWHNWWNRAIFFLKLSCFFQDPMKVDNLISDYSVSSKPSLHIWKFLVHVLLKPILKEFENNFANIWNESNCMVVWTFFNIVLLGIGMKTDLFQSCGHCWVNLYAEYFLQNPRLDESQAGIKIARKNISNLR